MKKIKKLVENVNVLAYEADEVVDCVYFPNETSSKEKIIAPREFSLIQGQDTSKKNLSLNEKRLHELAASPLGCDLLVDFYVKSIMDRGYLACRNCYWILSPKAAGQKTNRIN